MLDRRQFLSSGVALGAAAAFNGQFFAKVAAQKLLVLSPHSTNSVPERQTDMLTCWHKSR